MEEKRKNLRTDISFPVACDFLPHCHYFYTVCKDLSSGGIKIITDDFIPHNHLLKMNINLIDRAIDLKAKVMWCNKQRYADRYYAGLRFIEINDPDRVYLSRFITSTKDNHQ